MRWTHKVFQGIHRWPIINLVTLIYGYSYLILFEIVLGYWKLRRFQETEFNLDWWLEKPDVMYPSQNSLNKVVELFRRPSTMLEILYFNSDRQFFRKSPGIKFFYDFFIYWLGRHNLRPGRHFQQNYWLGKPPGHISLGHLDIGQGVELARTTTEKLDGKLLHW